MADYTLAVKVTGDISDYEGKMAKAGSVFDNLKNKIDGADFGSLGAKMSSIGKDVTKVGTALTSKITKPALVAGGALAGVTLAKGWSRMTEIDNARAKLTALGNSSKDVKTIMDNALKSVKGTAYGMDAAATTAASAVAAGIAPGKQLERYLTNVADAAAVAGIDMSEMGSIFNKVAANGKISAEEMNQLADRGIPVWKLLAQTTGMSMDEVRSAVSSGKIGIEELQNAIEEGMGGAAKTIGSSTISGALANFNASISRVGANLIGSADDADSLAGRLLPLFNAINSAMGIVEGKASSLGQTLGNMFGPSIEKLTNFFNKIASGETTIDAMTVKLAALGGGALVALGPMITIVGKAMTAFGALSSRIGGIASALGTTSGTLMKFAGIAGIVIAAFIAMYTNSESFRNAINNLVAVVGATLLNIFRSLGPLLQTVGQLVGNLATMFGNVLGPAIQILTPVINGVLVVFGGLLSVVASVMNGILSVVNRVVSFVASKLNFAGVVAKVTTVFTSIKTAITKPIEDARTKLSNVIEKIKTLFSKAKPKLNIKIPTITVSGGKAPFGIGGKGSLPKFHVNWNAKGAVFTQPTIFATPQGLQGVGEAGPEAVAPISTLQSYISAAVDNTGMTPAEIRQAIREGFMDIIPSMQEGILEAGESLTARVDNREVLRIVRKAVTT